MHRNIALASVSFVLASLLACSSSEPDPNIGGSGGNMTTGGSVGMGGNGTTQGGGTATQGGSSAGGATTTTSGGATSSSGGATKSSGGATNTGGATTTSGGATNTGGSTITGGSTSKCSTAATGTCAAPTVRVTDVTLSSAVVAPRDVASDLELLPMAISAIPSGGSRLAWMGTDSKVYVGTLDCDDKMSGTPFSFPAYDFQDLYADDDGGVLLITREATGTGTGHCGGPSPLCEASTAACYDMWLVRFDNAGNKVWETRLSKTSDTMEPYDNGARFTWWYQHHGRIAFDGANYASYFCTAITLTRSGASCVEIHEGDRMQVVSSAGALVANHADAMDVGCSHSWTTRLVWDPRTSHFVTVCATDNNCRIARSSPRGLTTLAASTCDGHLFGGDVVLASTAGFWTSYSVTGNIGLARFSTGGADQTISGIAKSDHSHLVSYGPSRMILAYGSGSSIAAQVRDAGTGDTQGSFTIAVPDHPYQAFKPYPDGSVAFPAKGANNTSAKIARVLPCSG